MADTPQRYTDPRTSQFIELLLAVGLLIGVHLTSYLLVRRHSNSAAYAAWAVCGTLGLAITTAVALVVMKRWHWGQFIYGVIAAFILSFLHLIVIAASD